MATRFGIAMVLSGLWVAAPGRVSSAPAAEVPQVLKMCRLGSITANASQPGAFIMTFMVYATNSSGTVSEQPMFAGINQPVQVRQKGPLKKVTAGPVAPGELVSFRVRDTMLFAEKKMTLLVSFQPALTDDLHLGINAIFPDPWAVPGC